MSGILRPQEYAAPTAEEKLRHVAYQAESSIVSMAQQIAMHLFQVRLIKQGEFEQCDIGELAKEVAEEALTAAIQASLYLDSQAHRIDKAAKELAQKIVERNPGMMG